MKTKILILIFSLFFGAVNGQEMIKQDLTETVTVKDTTLAQDSRLNYMLTTILPAVEKFMTEELARQKIAGNVTYEQETIKLYQDLQHMN